MSGSGARRRFRVASLDSGPDGLVDPGADVHRHLRVLRVVVGDEVFLFDGCGAEARAEVVRVDGASARLRIIERVRRAVESPLELCLVQAIPARATRMETIVRQTTELGVQRIVPVAAARSQQKKAGEAARQRLLRRWRAIADSAAEQSGRSRVPLIEEIRSFAGMNWNDLPRPLLLTDPAAEVTHPEEVGAPLHEGGETPTAATVMVGPEGGWTGAEIDAARAAGARPLQLGPRVLRADSAGAVAVTLLQYAWGDLRAPL